MTAVRDSLPAEQIVQEETYVTTGQMETAGSVNNTESEPDILPAEQLSTEVVHEETVLPTEIAEQHQVDYTKSTPVEEIMKKMTVEEAMKVKVDVGTCNGWTMGEVLERRRPSLKWYVYGYKEDNNIFRAAAQILLESVAA